MLERVKHILASHHAFPHWQALELASKKPSCVTTPLAHCFEKSKQRMIPTYGAAGRRWMVVDWILAKLSEEWMRCVENTQVMTAT